MTKVETTKPSTFAIIKTGGKQIRVEVGEKVKIEKLPQKEGEEVIFEEVLLFVNGDTLQIGKPFLEKVAVNGKVIKHGRGDKIVVIKMQPKKRRKSKQGHRQDYSEVEITKIDTAAKKAEVKAPVKKLIVGKEAVKKSSIKATVKKTAVKKVEKK